MARPAVEHRHIAAERRGALLELRCLWGLCRQRCRVLPDIRVVRHVEREQRREHQCGGMAIGVPDVLRPGERVIPPPRLLRPAEEPERVPQPGQADHLRVLAVPQQVRPLVLAPVAVDGYLEMAAGGLEARLPEGRDAEDVPRLDLEHHVAVPLALRLQLRPDRLRLGEVGPGSAR
ncbi:MAG: hypothetical protein ACRDZO_12400 [Egibacteraceae bacterium]